MTDTTYHSQQAHLTPESESPGPDSPGQHEVEHTHYEEPRTREQIVIAGIWEQLLQTEKVGIGDNFLLLGGESLLAIQAAARLREAFGIDVPVRSILLETVGEIAQAISEQPDSTVSGITR
jgi:acyl carrier protein